MAYSICEFWPSMANQNLKRNTKYEIQTAATMTMNSPESLAELYNLATAPREDKQQAVETAELMREIGLKCIGFNGVRLLIVTQSSDFEPYSEGRCSTSQILICTRDQVPRTINCLGAFRASLPKDVVDSLSTTPTR